MSGEYAGLCFPADESDGNVMKSVAAQLTANKGAWFREDEGSPNNE
jgi:hypothetical protein